MLSHIAPDVYLVVFSLCIVALLGCVGLLFRPQLKKYAPDIRSRRFAHIAEPAILLLLLPICVGWPLIAPGNLGRLTAEPVLWSHDTQVRLWLVYITAVGLTCILATRLVSSRAGVVMACIGLALAGFGTLWWSTAAAPLQKLHAEDFLNVYSSQWFVPSAFMAVRIFVWALATLLGGLYAVRRGFSWPMYLVGALVAGGAAYFALMPFWAWTRSWTAVLAFTAFAAALIALPLQREAIERLVGFPLSRREVGHTFVSKAEDGYVGHGALFVLAVFFALSAIVNYFEGEQVRMFSEGPRKPMRSPALRNAYAELKPLVLEPVPSRLDTLPYPADFHKYVKLFQTVTSDTRAELFESTGWEAFRRYDSDLRDYTDALEHAARADYLEFPNSATTNLFRIQNVFSLIGIRSQLAIHEGRTLDAANDIKTLYRVCGLLNQQPWAVAQSIGFYSRQVANGAAYNAVIQLRNDEQGLLALASAMDAAASAARVGLDFEPLYRGEGGLLAPVVPNADLLIGPRMQDVSFVTISYRNGLLGWVNFDLVRLAVAVELYRLQNGEYPQDLQEITPGYMNRLPLDPIDGESYQYRQTGNKEYELRCPSVPDSWAEKSPLQMPFTFPLSRAGYSRDEVTTK